MHFKIALIVQGITSIKGKGKRLLMFKMKGNVILGIVNFFKTIYKDCRDKNCFKSEKWWFYTTKTSKRLLKHGFDNILIDKKCSVCIWRGFHVSVWMYRIHLKMWLRKLVKFWLGIRLKIWLWNSFKDLVAKVGQILVRNSFKDLVVYIQTTLFNTQKISLLNLVFKLIQRIEIFIDG